MTTLATPRAGTRAWAGLAVLMLPVLLVSIDNTVLSFALPTISRELRPSAAEQLWIVDVYALVLSGLLVGMGNLGDRFGRRRMLMIGATGFALISAAAAFATDASQLIGARILMGVFGAMIMPATLSLLRSLFQDRTQRRLAIAIWATGFSAGAAIGPILGGILLEHFGWGAIFLMAVPFLVPLLIGAPLLVPESRDSNPGPFDLISIVLSGLALAPLVYAIKHTATDGPDLIGLAALVVAVVSGTLFVRRLLRRENPMLDVRLFTNPGFTGAILVNFVSVLSLVGLLFFVAQHLQLVAGMSPVEAALVLVPGTVGMILAGLGIVRLVRHAPMNLLMAGGLVLSGSAYVIMAVIGGEISVIAIALAFLLISVGVGSAETLSNDVIIASVPADKAGAASAVSETAYEFGAVIGTAVLGSILTGVYRQQLVVPEGVPAADAAAAGETLGAAVDVAGSLPDALGAELLASAGHAFDAGVVATSWIGAGLMAVAVVLTLTLLRGTKAH